MTGRYAANTGLVWPMVPGCPAGLPDGMDTLPRALKRSGYRTAMAGKHHLGHAQWKQTPSGIGFDEFVGCFMWDIDSYRKQMYENAWTPITLDWVQTFANRTYRHYAEPRHATEAITSEAQRMISSHRQDHADQSLFLYVSFTAAHSPLQPMPEHEAACKHIKHLWRRQFCGMVVGLDEGLRNITQTVLAELGSDTILIFSSDNGGSTWFGGLNVPYRGGKSTPLEGGVRVPAFAVDFSEDNRFLGEGNWSYDGMIHISDWFPTLLSVAGESLDRFKASGGDGIDMSRSLLRKDQNGHRHEALLEMYEAKNFIYDENLVSYVMGDMKLIEGFIRDPLYYYESEKDILNNSGTSKPYTATLILKICMLLDQTLVSVFGEAEIRIPEAIFGNGPFDTSRVAITHSRIHPRLGRSGKIPGPEPGSTLLLFNLTADPLESDNVAAKHPDIVAEIRSKLELIRAGLPAQQKFWMQSHMINEWPKTFVSGDCSMNPEISPEDCHFTHPWVPDSKDPWDQKLVDGGAYADEQLDRILISLISVTVILTVVAGLSIFFCFCWDRGRAERRNLTFSKKEKKS